MMALLAVLLLASPAESREPTEFEQFMLELINRARANPNGEVTRLSALPWGDDGTATPDLNEGLVAGTISSAAKQPLAFNLLLIDAASDYADTLLANDAFDHEFAGTTPSSRMTVAGYSFDPPPAGSGENLAVTASSGPHPINAERIEDHHASLFVDRNVPGRGHRVNLMSPDFQEVGLGVRSAGDYGLFPGAPNAVLTVQNFAFTNGNPFLTGVAYLDVDQDGFYTPDIGEPVGGLTVQAFEPGTSNSVGSTTTFASGGYSLRLAPGTYDVVFSGPGFQRLVAGFDFTGGQNVKLDALVPEPSGLVLLALGLVALLPLVRRRR